MVGGVVAGAKGGWSERGFTPTSEELRTLQVIWGCLGVQSFWATATEPNVAAQKDKTLPDGWLVVVYYSRHIPSRDPVHEVFLAMWHINVWDVLDVLHCINSNLYHLFVCVLFLFYVYFLSLWHCLFEHIWVNSSLNTLCSVFLYSFGHTPVLQVVLAVEASLILWWSNDLWTSCCQVSQKVSE